MTDPTVRIGDVRSPKLPNLSPLIQWLEDNKVISPGTVATVNTLADKLKGLSDALKQGGIRL